jgi:fimbrial chaperone protein
MQIACRSAVLLAMWLLAAGAQAGTFSAIPVRITLTSSETVSLLLENQGEDAVLVQSEVLAWSQQDGKDELVPSRELLVSPPIFKLAAGGKQTVRIGLLRSFDPARELTYRLYLQEVPPPRAPEQSVVTTALRLSLPVFVLPPKSAVAPVLNWRAIASPDSLNLTLSNSGNAHIQISALKLSLPDGSLLADEKVFTYVLPGQAHSWAIKLKQPLLGEKLRLTAETDNGAVNAEIGLDSN